MFPLRRDQPCLCFFLLVFFWPANANTLLKMAFMRALDFGIEEELHALRAWKLINNRITIRKSADVSSMTAVNLANVLVDDGSQDGE